MSAYVHGDWLWHYYQQYYRSSRQAYFSASTSLALVSLLAVSLTPSTPTGDATVRVSALLGGIAFGMFLLASLLLLYASVHDEQTIAALAYERELEAKDMARKPLGGAWHRSIHSSQLYAKRGIWIAEGPPEAPLQQRWHEQSKTELFRRRKYSFWLAVSGRFLMIAATIVLLATVVCIGKYKITPGSADDGLWIALLVTLSVVAILIVCLVGHQDVYSELFQPGPAPVQRERL